MIRLFAPRHRGVTAVAALACLSTCLACTSAGAGMDRADGIALERVAWGLDNPVHISAPAGDERLFIVEQPGRIRILAAGELRAEPFLDIRAKVRSGGERGLLSVAFHPQYASNGYFYVNYSDRTDGHTVIERYRVSDDPDRAVAESASRLLEVDQPFSNHNGGHILFGHDGMLWIGMGDGGAANDPRGNGQNLHTLLGAMLRIDVDAEAPYAIPADNPFAGNGNARPEIWAYGVRNPWRFWIDRVDTLVYIADVGQNRWEEVHVERADAAGLNYGWNVLEGSRCFGGGRCDREGMLSPAVEYEHRDGCSVTGGIVYRGSTVAALAGHYVYSDYCKGWLRSFRYVNGHAMEQREWSVTRPGNVSSFGEGGDGEVYLATLEGDVFKIVAREPE